MARVLFINGGSEGHINPTIGVVEELISHGEEVVYFCIEAYKERIEMTGLQYEHLTIRNLYKLLSQVEEIMYWKESTAFYLRQI